MIDPIEVKKKKISGELEDAVEEAREIAKDLGLDPRPVNYWIVDYDEMNELIARDGFQKRYPHWRWGMKYDKQRKQGQYMGGKAFEIVNNDDPSHAFLQMSNSFAKQKEVIAHVEAHSDFFKNNNAFQDNPASSDMLARHADKIEKYMTDPDIDREEVEKWIDHVHCLIDNIDQHSDYVFKNIIEEDDSEYENVDPVDNLDIRDSIKDSVFEDGWNEDEESELPHGIDDTEKDILAFLVNHGKQFDEQKGQAVEYEDWQIDILEMMREEAYYFAPQKMTKCMNEGWAAVWESVIMASEEFANDEDIIDYAQNHARVLSSPGFNPYQLGKALWLHIENTVNRREVVDKLLCIEGVNPDNFHRKIDFQKVHDILDERDSDDIVKRNYSLTRQQNQDFIQKIGLEELRKMNRYLSDAGRYESVEEALDDVDYEAGWKRMREVRETHTDVMFIDEFLTQDFVDKHDYYTWEFRFSDEMAEIASRDVEDVRKKLLLQFTNFGKPTIEVATGNYNNSGELLLLHNYNGVVLDGEKAMNTMERIHNLWGRPINLATVGKTIPEEELDYAYSEGVEPEPIEEAFRIRYDGEEIEEHDLEEEIADKIMAEDLDYDTKPDDWL